jgi:hypothetical protein
MSEMPMMVGMMNRGNKAGADKRTESLLLGIHKVTFLY